MGINYIDSVVVYNKYYNNTTEKEQYFGTRFDGVRVEFTKEENQSRTGSEDVSSCVLKIPSDETLKKQYVEPKSWEELTTDEMLKTFTLNVDGDFFVIVKKKGLNLDIDAPVGIQYMEGFLDYMKENYGFVYSIISFASLELITYFQVGGR